MRNLKLALLLLTMLGCSTVVQAHALLEHASPAVGSTVASSPGSVTLNVMRLGVGGLRPGRYSVTWHALSVDTHKTQGSFSFQVGK
jgi:copper resistance protein C